MDKITKQAYVQAFEEFAKSTDVDTYLHYARANAPNRTVHLRLYPDATWEMVDTNDIKVVDLGQFVPLSIPCNMGKVQLKEHMQGELNRWLNPPK